METKFEV